MFNKLTKIKILLIFLLFIVFIIKRDSIKSYLSNSDYKVTTDVKVVDISNKDQNFNKNSGNNIAVAKMAILITDLGLQSEVLEKAFHTNPKIGLGISIYAENLTNILKESSDTYGHDTMVLLPTQTSDYSRNDPGPHAMLMDGSITENARKLHDVISKLISNNIGIYLSPLSAFAFKEDRAMSLIKLLEDYSTQFKFFVYYDRDHSNFLTKLFPTSNVLEKSIIVHQVIDYGNADYVKASLDDLKNIAITKNQTCIVFIPPQVQSIEGLESWMKANADKIEVLSISDILKTRKTK